jgi:23S rRNA (adenine2503-C2)-methyltransferase
LGVTLDLSRASSTPRAAVKPNLSGLTRPELAAALIAAEVVRPEKARMRATQLWRWIHHYGVTDFAAMSDVAKEMRASLAEAFTIARPEIVERQVSKDGTRKWLIRTAPGIEIETVYIPDVGRSGALCVSSQVGCTLNCTFCHTGTQALVRNLTAAEIVAQAQIARDDLREWMAPEGARRLTNIVFMGMGEPLANFNALSRALRRITEPPPAGLGIGQRHVTVSTVGLVPGIERLIAEDLQVTLAVSLHAPDDELRDTLVPVNTRWKVAEVLDAAWRYADTTGRRVSIEYAMIRDINDQAGRAHLLGKLLAGKLVHVNLIPLNPTPGSVWTASDPASERAFVEILRSYRVATTVRDTRGREIDGACGQLAADVTATAT